MAASNPTDLWSWPEAVVAAAGTVLAVVATVSLAVAVAGAWTFAAVTLVSGIALGAIVAVGWRRYGAGHPILGRESLVGLALVVPAVAIGAFLLFPGHEFGMAGWDPGVYQNQAVSITETGGLDRPNPAAGFDLSVGSAPRLPGIPPDDDDPDRLQFSFFHLYPALGAVGHAVSGATGVASVNPILALVATAAAVLALRRLVSPLAGVAAGVIVSTNAVWVWHGRWPSSEMVTAALIAVAMLAGAIAWDTRRGPWWIGVGIPLAASANGRLDGALVLVFVAGLVALLFLLGRPAAAGWLGCSAIPGAALWFTQALYTADAYTAHRSATSPLALLPVLLVIPLLALQLRLVARAPLDRTVGWFRDRPSVVPRVAFGAVVLAGGALWLRHQSAPAARIGDENSFDAHTIWRMLLFLGVAGGIALLVGLADTMRDVRLGSRSVLVLVPGLATLAIYFIDPVIHPRLIWAVRRVVPYGWLPLLLAVSIGVTAPARWFRGWLRVVGVGVSFAFGASVVLAQWDLLTLIESHDELEGSEEFAEQLAAVVGDGVVLWVEGESFKAFASTLLVRHDADVIPVAADELDAAVAAVHSEEPERAVYVIADAGDAEVAAVLAGRPVTTVSGSYPYLGFTYFEMPDRIDRLDFAADMWELRA